MNKKNLFAKIVFVVVILLLLLSLVAPAIFSQRTFRSPHKDNLLNGLKVYVWPEPGAGKVFVSVRVHSGSAFDPQGKEGVMKMLAENLFPNEATVEFFEEDLGGSLNVSTTYDYIQVDASSRPDSFLLMLETISTAFADPPIDRETTVKLRDRRLESVRADSAKPSTIAHSAVISRLYGTFPYGRMIDGTVDSVSKIEFADLIDARERFLSSDNATLTISGGVDRSLALRAARRYFGGWQKADRKIPATFRQPNDPPAGSLILESPAAEGAESRIAFRIAFRGVSRGDKDLAPSHVFTRILEDRLKKRVAGENAEALFVQNQNYLLNGTIIVGSTAVIGTSGKIGGGVAIEIIKILLSEPVTESEFQSAKSGLAAEWRDRGAVSFWLDADTFKLKSAEADRKAFDDVKIADVQAFVGRLQRAATASVSVYVTAPRQAEK